MIIPFALDGLANETRSTYRSHVWEPVRIGGGIIRSVQRDLTGNR